ncbi:antizyme inhibitor 1b isoform X1 [Syngnathus acus]|uniref:antizyme inhibitor 1b isoform X1 n=1 Tax=Syngnathus acus TaxID=161584 RepID=UPI001885F3CF|nr:antizyme inhibitor 1b isoform X1 [Syngnathus acus]
MKGFTDRPDGYTVELLESGATLNDVIDERICQQALAEKSAFMVADLGALMHQHARWRSTAPRLQPYFPLRCNRSPAVVEVLASLGLGFVCASKAEVNLALEHGASPNNIILAGVCKQLALVKAAAKHDVCHLVCENEAELAKIARLHPRAKLLLQLSTEAHAAETSVAFGATLKSCCHLLEVAKTLGVRVVGVAFHVPTSCQEPQRAYGHALADARCLFDMGADLGFTMNILDIGSGFTGSEFQLKEVEAAVSPLLDAYFPPLSGVHVLAQPGSFYVASAFSLAVSIIAKEVVTRRWDAFTPAGNDDAECAEFLYYMNEGVYGPFGAKLLGNTITAPAVHKQAPCAATAAYPSRLRGPTLDQIDLVVERCLLPELSVGDWLLFANMGACGLDVLAGHTCASPQPPVYYAATSSDWYKMQEVGVTLEGAVKTFAFV